MKRTLKALLALLLCCSLLPGFACAESSAPDPSFADGTGFPAIGGFSVNGTTALLYDLNSEMIIYGQNIDAQIYPASLAKILTCLVAIENGNLTDNVTVTQTALQGIDPDGTNTDLEPGEVLPLRDLLFCMMLASDNEACNVIAEHISGSVAGYVELLNQKAAALGCTGSHFANTHGLHDDQEYTTARDLLRITRAALQNATFCEIISETSHELPATAFHEKRTIYTTNHLTSTQQSYKYYDNRTMGIKTGYTSKAGRCLITTAEDGPMHLLSIVTGCTTETDEHGEYVLNNFVESEKLLEYGFEHFVFVNVLSTLMPISEVPVTGGERSSVVVEPLQDAALSLPKDYDSADITTAIELYGGSPLSAPLHAGQPIGRATVYYQGKPMRTVEITPITDVAEGEIVYAEQTPKEPEAEATKKPLDVKSLLLTAALILLGGYAVFNLLLGRSKKKKRRKKKASYHSSNPSSRRPTGSSTRSSSQPRPSGTASKPRPSGSSGRTYYDDHSRSGNRNGTGRR